MTGSQPHPGTGQTMMGEISQKVSIEAILKAVGVQFVETCSPLDLKKAEETVKQAAAHKGVSAVIFRRLHYRLQASSPFVGKPGKVHWLQAVYQRAGLSRHFL